MDLNINLDEQLSFLWNYKIISHTVSFKGSSNCILSANKAGFFPQEAVGVSYC